MNDRQPANTPPTQTPPPVSKASNRTLSVAHKLSRPTRVHLASPSKRHRNSCSLTSNIVDVINRCGYVLKPYPKLGPQSGRNAGIGIVDRGCPTTKYIEDRMKRVGLYLRVSTDEQTIENQRLALMEACVRRGWQVVEEFVDDG